MSEWSFDDVDYYDDLQKTIPGVRFTSGFRTKEYQEDMRRRGYKPAENSGHLLGEKLDLLPPEGKSMGWLHEQIRKHYPEAQINPHEGDHADVRFPGYRNAPALGNAVAAGVENPNRGWSFDDEGDEPPLTATVTDTSGSPAPADDGFSYEGDDLVPVEQSRGFFDRLGHAYEGNVQYGFPGLVARKLLDWTGAGMEEIRKLHPNATPEELEMFQEEAINESQKTLREQYEAETTKDPAWRPDEGWVDNILSGRWAAAVPGIMAGQAGPEMAINPGGTAIGRMAMQGVANAGADMVYQGADVADEVADKYNPEQTVISGLAGAGFQGLSELGSAAVGRMINRRSGTSANPDEYADGPVMPKADEEGPALGETADGELDPNAVVSDVADAAPVNVPDEDTLTDPDLGTDDALYHYEDETQRKDVRVYNEDEVRELIRRRLGGEEEAAPDVEVDPALTPEQRLYEAPPERQDELPFGDDFEAGGGREEPAGHPIRKLLNDKVPQKPTGPTQTDKYADNINLERLSTDAEEDEILRTLVKDTSGDVQTHEDTILQAKEMLRGMTAADLLRHDPKLSEGSKYGLAIRTTEVAAVRRMKELARDILDPTKKTPALEAQLQKMTIIADAATKRAQGVAKLSGRNLNSLKIIAGANDDAALVSAVRKLNNLSKNDLGMEDFAKLIHENADNPEALAKLIKNANDPYWEDYITSFRYSLMLSGVGTHMKNILGNTLLHANNILDHAGAVAIGKVTQPFRSSDRIAAREVAARFNASAQALLEGATWAKTAKAFKEGTPTDQVSKVEVNPNLMPGLLSVPQRALAAEDQFFRAIIQNSELYGLAHRKALQEGLKGPAYEARVQGLIAEPTQDMLKKSANAAEVTQLLDEPSWVGKWAENAKRKRAGMGAGARVGRFAANMMVPFARVSDRLLWQAIRRSPLGVFDGINRADFQAGGARRDLAISRVMQGSVLAGIFANMAYNDQLSGAGPENYQKRMDEEASGKQWNSVKIGDRWYNLAGADNIAIHANTIASFVQKFKAGEIGEEQFLDDMLNVVGTLGKSVADSTFLGDVGSFFEMFGSGPRASLARQNYLNNMVGSFTTPAIVRQAEGIADPLVRDATGDGSTKDRLTGKVASGWPSLSTTLPQRFDNFGNAIQDQSGVLADVTGIGKSREQSSDPVHTELMRLNDMTSKSLIGPAGKNITINGEKVRLNAEDFQAYQRLSGQYIVESIRQQMSTPEWKASTDEQKAQLIKKTAEAQRKNARQDLFENPNGDGGWTFDD